MHIDALTEPEQRVLGCLIEKRLTTPDQYPLTLNALRLACNQSTNRNPVVAYDETTVREAAQRLARYGLTRLASGHSSRAVKYRHLAEDALGVDQQQLALLALLLLRGEQTAGELRLRAERMTSFASLELVDAALAELCERGYAERVARRPGQKEDRFRQLLGGSGAATRLGQDTPDVGHDHPEYAVRQDRAEIPANHSLAFNVPPEAAPMPGAGDTNLLSVEARLASIEGKIALLAEAIAELRRD